MTRPPMMGKKLSLYGKPLKMLPEIELFKSSAKKPLRAGVKFWPEPEEDKDDKLPESK